MVLVLMGCGSAVFAGSAAGAVSAGVGTLGVAFAFGLSVVAMAYAIGGISGWHINPAITLGVLLSGRMSGKDAAMYMVFQVIGAVIGSAILYALVSTGAHGGPTATGSNGFADGMMLQAFIAEAVFTFIFVLVVLGSTDSCTLFVFLLRELLSILPVASVRHCSRVARLSLSCGCSL